MQMTEKVSRQIKYHKKNINMNSNDKNDNDDDNKGLL